MKSFREWLREGYAKKDFYEINKDIQLKVKKGSIASYTGEITKYDDETILVKKGSIIWFAATQNDIKNYFIMDTKNKEFIAVSSFEGFDLSKFKLNKELSNGAPKYDGADQYSYLMNTLNYKFKR